MGEWERRTRANDGGVVGENEIGERGNGRGELERGMAEVGGENENEG